MDRGKEEALNLLNKLNIPFDEKNFIDRVRENDLEAVNLFLQAGMSPNEADFDGSIESFKTAPMIAAEKGYIKMFRLLLKNNDKYLGEAFFWAIACGQENIVEEFFEELVKEDTYNLSRGTALHASASHGQLNILKMLLEKGIDVDARGFQTDDYSTSLIVASSAGETEIVKYLIEMNANPNLLDRYSETALMKACYGGYFNIAEILINAGADLETKNDDGKTALMIAQEKGHQEIVEFIKKIFFRVAFIFNKLRSLSSNGKENQVKEL